MMAPRVFCLSDARLIAHGLQMAPAFLKQRSLILSKAEGHIVSHGADALADDIPTSKVVDVSFTGVEKALRGCKIVCRKAAGIGSCKDEAETGKFVFF